jgi:hypothetical protein
LAVVNHFHEKLREQFVFNSVRAALGQNNVGLLHFIFCYQCNFKSVFVASGHLAVINHLQASCEEGQWQIVFFNFSICKVEDLR